MRSALYRANEQTARAKTNVKIRLQGWPFAPGIDGFAGMDGECARVLGEVWGVRR